MIYGTLDKKISLALSGGGTRAMAFHAGMLRLLAEKGKLESISKISTVSGGSLLVSLIYQKSSGEWPSSNYYLSHVYDEVRNEMCQKSLQSGMIKMLLKPKNWRFVFSRANLLSQVLNKKWGVTYKLSDIRKYPEWSINGTTAETGKRFRFRNDSIGDYTIGYACPNDFLLSDAVSVSAAFPGGIGPYSLSTAHFRWLKGEWGDRLNCSEVSLPYKKLRIYDGGVYDNLGLEPFFDHSKQVPKEDSEIIICSDAGAPLQVGFDAFSLSPWRLKRVADIISEQSRSLRIRAFVNYIMKSQNGFYFGISNPNVKKQHDELSRFSCGYSTSLKKFRTEDFDKIAEHGYIVAKNITENVNFSGW
ncbi:patatin-like phospholipase family protein [Enterobacter sp. A11]|uniref:patatin-like phospholipase family protein n=1 Tax=unclassified Enterobacter TaxID=2608935 RepID=UPI00107029B2|nr:MULTISPECIES: patatin-like phospholipase family protein [unclassified Enterobacter]MBM1020188.1 patatin-like phospholipase family protein [Enterobacter sp. E1]MEA3561489.1 patatin-like phospholipase family protein [Enterobacter sp. GM-22]MEA3595214.1 patatin-like phospholipase family protein [Enterobacter sp. GM-31]TFF60352.1 patatin-like phospholipase family protein [Enterobacter sp. A11]